MQVQPYLSFEGRAEEAIEFYKKTLGAKVTMLMRFKDAPEPCPGMNPPPDKVMHASLLIGDTAVMMSDGRCAGDAAGFKGISLSLTGDNDAHTEKLYNALLDNGSGSPCVPLGKTFFASKFGIVTDKFGVTWMCITAS
jgi:PhnB protein